MSSSTNQFILQKQRESILSALTSQTLTDVTFKIGTEGNEYRITRSLLAFISPVFKAMLCGPMMEGQSDSEIILEDMKPDVFDSIVKFAYINDPGINMDIMFPLITACDRYQIRSLVECCYQVLRSKLNNNNFMNYFQRAAREQTLNGESMRIMANYLGQNYKRCLSTETICSFFHFLVTRNSKNKNLDRMIEQCHRYLDQVPDDKFMQTINSNGFRKMSLKAMRLFLIRHIQRDRQEIWTAVVKWAEHQTKGVANDKVSLLKSVKDLIGFKSMGSWYFVQNVLPLNVLTRTEVTNVLGKMGVTIVLFGALGFFSLRFALLFL